MPVQSHCDLLFLLFFPLTTDQSQPFPEPGSAEVCFLLEGVLLSYCH